MPVFVVRDCVKIVEDYKTKQTYLHVHVYLLNQGGALAVLRLRSKKITTCLLEFSRRPVLVQRNVAETSELLQGKPRRA